MNHNISSFCEEQRQLLQLELQSESLGETSNSKLNDSNDAPRSHVLHGLAVDHVSVGLYGRTVVTLHKSNFSLLPAHRFTTGDEAEIRSSNSKAGSVGVVSQVTDESIAVALFGGSIHKSSKKNEKGKGKKQEDDKDNDDNVLQGSPPFSLLPKSSIEVHHKLVTALNDLGKHGVDHPVAGTVIRSLFDASSNSSAEVSTRAHLPDEPTNLDASQREAISFALGGPNRPVALIHGPPGSGKTTTLVQLIRQAVLRHDYRVLVTAPSNVAVDNVLAKLVSLPSSSDKKRRKKNLRVVRLGHPARLQTDILPYSLEALVQSAEGTEIVHDVREEIRSYLKVVSNPKAKHTDKAIARRELRLLTKEVRSREEEVVRELLTKAQVVMATCVGAGSALLRDAVIGKFDVVIIDEAAQALESACWIPALKASQKLILAGDHCQLPPTIRSNDPAVQRGLSRTMFERVLELYGNQPQRVSRMLCVQYRMNEMIANWASQAMYDGKLTTHEGVRQRLISDLVEYRDDAEQQEDIDIAMITETPLLLIDTAGCELHESVNAAGSKFNTGEANLVAQHVRSILRLGVQQSQLAVISPYNGQVEILRSLLLPDFPKLEVRTVDGFQGSEKEAVVLSLVRSSARSGQGRGCIGFLRDDRRLNVAVTRARRHCCVVCDSDTVSQSPFINGLLTWIEANGYHQSAMLPIGNSETQERSTTHALKALQASLQQESKHSEERNNKSMKEAPIEDRLLNSIRKFAESGRPGDSMDLSHQLTKAHRKSVHELAEELGIEHESRGTEGVDRYITIRLPGPMPTDKHKMSIATPVDVPDSTDMIPLVGVGRNSSTGHEPELVDIPNDDGVSAFTILREAGDDEDESTDTEHDVPQSTSHMSNADLAALARERRERETLGKASETKAVATTHTQSKKKKNKGRKLGGIKRQPALDLTVDDNGLDDMAFLDAQIEKVQNSHGRTIKGDGVKYRTVVNGILLSKPSQSTNPKKKDTRASAALHSKLKQAQDDRRQKSKKK